MHDVNPLSKQVLTNTTQKNPVKFNSTNPCKKKKKFVYFMHSKIVAPFGFVIYVTFEIVAPFEF